MNDCERQANAREGQERKSRERRMYGDARATGAPVPANARKHANTPARHQAQAHRPRTRTHQHPQNAKRPPCRSAAHLNPDGTFPIRIQERSPTTGRPLCKVAVGRRTLKPTAYLQLIISQQQTPKRQPSQPAGHRVPRPCPQPGCPQRQPSQPCGHPRQRTRSPGWCR